MNDQRQPRDPFYSTFAVVALAVACIGAFAPTGDKPTAAPMASVQPVPVSMVWADPNPSSSRAVDQAHSELGGVSMAAADRALVGASIANYDQ